MEPTGFLGLSHLGLVGSIGWASRGDPVVAVDLDRDTVDLLSRSGLPLHEPELPGLLAASSRHLTFTTDVSALAACPLVILSQDVPTADDDSSDLSPVRQLLDRVLPHLRSHATLVVMSQVPPGFTRGVAARVLRERPAAGVHVYYWVETLILGRAVERYLRPERIILGCADPRAALPDALARGLERFGCPILPMRYESAELTKTAINLYLAGAVTYANTLSDLCEQIGADWSEMIPALRLDARIGSAAYIRPGLGIAGGNLERDLVTLQRLAATRGADASYIETIIAHNSRRLRWVFDRLEHLVFSEVSTPTIAVWGLAYKKSTQSVKNSPALRVIEGLRGRALVRAYDPVVRGVAADGLAVVAHRDDAVAGADCLLIMTDWEEFAAADPAALRRSMRRPLIVDPVGVLAGRCTGLDGIRYVSMGRGEAG